MKHTRIYMYLQNEQKNRRRLGFIPRANWKKEHDKKQEKKKSKGL